MYRQKTITTVDFNVTPQITLTATAGEHIYFINSDSGQVEVTLPPAVDNKATFIFKTTVGASGYLIYPDGSDMIEDDGNYNMTTLYTSIVLNIRQVCWLVDSFELHYLKNIDIYNRWHAQEDTLL